MKRAVAAAAFLLAACVAFGAQGPAPRQDLRFGLRVGPSGWVSLPEVLKSVPLQAKNPLGVTLVLPLDWAREPRWADLDSAVAGVLDSGARLHLLTALAHPPDSEEARAYLVRLSGHAAPAASLGLSLDWSQVPMDLASDAGRLALCIKRLTAAIRGDRSGVEVYLGDMTAGEIELLDPLYLLDLRAYVDGYSSSAAEATGSAPGGLVKYLREHHPGAPLWLHLPKLSTPIGAQLAVLAAAYRDIPFVDLETDHPAEIWKALADLRAQIPPGMGPGFAAQAVSISGAGGEREDLGTIHLLDSDTLRQGILIVPTKAGGQKETLNVTVPTEDVAAPKGFTLPAGPVADLKFRTDSAAHQTRLDVPYEGRAVLLTLDRLKTGAVGGDSLSVSDVYRIPVEVILARHQGMQLAQEEALQNYRCGAEVAYHFRLPGGTGSVDVTFLNSFFFEKGEGARWVQDKLLLNGVAWKGKRIPELPVIEPEKVNVLPLALTLGRDYTYRYIRDEEVDGVPCYLVEFFPSASLKGSFYTGKAWIEKETFQKRRMSVRQAGLQEPQVSNEETDEYRGFQGPDGKTYRLLASVKGQMIFSLAGRNILAERSITFGLPEINKARFHEDVREAEASDKPILQDTEKGLRYLEKAPDGTRRLEMNPKTRRTIAVAGLYTDPSLRYPLPLLGVAYMDYAWRGSKNQLNLFATGVVNTLDMSKVNLWPKVDGRLDGVFILVPLDDRFYEGREEVKGQRIQILRETVSAGLGWRPWEFLKLSVGTDLAYYHYSRSSKTAQAFVLPKSHADMALTLSADFSRRGWSADADGSYHKRSSWEPWGTTPSEARADRARDYFLWNTSFSKSFYLPKFQKISVSTSWLDGSDLDRFSKYTFTYLGKYKMAGFAGSGVRFGRGGLVHLIYEFNLAEVVRFSLQMDAGRVQPVRTAGLWERHGGVGVSGSIVGPWRTYWTLDVGRAVASDIGPLRGQTTAALLVMKFW